MRLIAEIAGRVSNVPLTTRYADQLGEFCRTLSVVFFQSDGRSL